MSLDSLSTLLWKNKQIFSMLFRIISEYLYRLILYTGQNRSLIFVLYNFLLGWTHRVDDDMLFMAGYEEQHRQHKGFLRFILQAFAKLSATTTDGSKADPAAGVANHNRRKSKARQLM